MVDNTFGLDPVDLEALKQSVDLSILDTMPPIVYKVTQIW